MGFLATNRAPLGIAAVVAATLALGGCQGGAGGVLGLGGQRSPTEDRAAITQDELRAFCPGVELRSDQAFFNTYERNGDGDPARIVHQAAITDVTRACEFGPGTVSITVGVAGRVVPGPKAVGGTVDLPVRVVVVQGSEQLLSELVTERVTIAPGAPATQFVFSRAGLTIPAPQRRNVRVFVGYEQRAEARRR